MDLSKTYLNCPQIPSSLTKSNSLNILDLYKHYYHPRSERMKFITQEETPVITINDVRDIVEVDAQGNEIAITPADLPIIWLTNDVSPQTITEMMAEGKYTICIYTDIEKDAAEEAGYQKPLVLINDVYLSLPNTCLLMITDDNHNSGEVPLLFLQARDLCDQVFNPVPLPDSQEYDLRLHALGIRFPPYKPSSPSPSPVPIPTPIISIPVPPSKGKAKAIEAKKPTPPLSFPKKTYGDICPKCKRPYLYDHTAWAQGKTDGYTCRCKKDDAPPPSSPPLVPLAPRPCTPSPKTTTSEQVNPVTTTRVPRERSFPYVSYDQFDQRSEPGSAIGNGLIIWKRT